MYQRYEYEPIRKSGEREIWRRAKLLNGNIVYYDFCSETFDSYGTDVYIGQGRIFEINGVKQIGSNELYYFWVKRETYKRSIKHEKKRL